MRIYFQHQGKEKEGKGQYAYGNDGGQQAQQAPKGNGYAFSSVKAVKRRECVA